MTKYLWAAFFSAAILFEAHGLAGDKGVEAANIFFAIVGLWSVYTRESNGR